MYLHHVISNVFTYNSFDKFIVSLELKLLKNIFWIRSVLLFWLAFLRSRLYEPVSDTAENIYINLDSFDSR